MSDQEKEWLLTDATGTFAMGCADRKPRRKYHSLLSIADGLSPAAGKNLVLDIAEQLQADEQVIALADEPVSFRAQPRPAWSWNMKHPQLGELRLERELSALERGAHADFEAGFRVSYVFSRGTPGPAVKIRLRPLLLSRPIHLLKESNPRLNGMPIRKSEDAWIFRLYDTDPAIVLCWEGATPQFDPQGAWEDIDHPWEAERGYDSKESCFSPGFFSLDWDGASRLEFSVCVGFTTGAPAAIRSQRLAKPRAGEASHPVIEELRASALSFPADVEEDGGLSPSLIAGYPWFGPWTRDLFLSLPGYSLAAPDSELPYLMMATGGRRLLASMASEEAPSGASSSVNVHGADSPWLYLWALEHLTRQEALTGVQKQVLFELGADLASAVVNGRQAHVTADPNGGLLIEAGPWACTWMDALIDGVPVTPRNGYPIEINALFLSGLGFLLEQVKSHPGLRRINECHSASKSRFEKLFTEAGRDWLIDVAADPSNRAETSDSSLRPNSLWALALPRVPVSQAMALSTLQAVRSQLLTPVGLRTLSPHESGYRGEYRGDLRARDQAYHQGTVWPWLLGVYADAVLRWEGRLALAQDLIPIRKRLETHLFEEGCLGHVSEIFDGAFPHQARGAPAQAWSACELFRMFEELRA